VIGLGNIPYKASRDDIIQYLEENLKIKISGDNIIFQYNENYKPTGDARIVFETKIEAKLACYRLKGTHMWNQMIFAAIIQ